MGKHTPGRVRLGNLYQNGLRTDQPLTALTQDGKEVAWIRRGYEEQFCAVTELRMALKGLLQPHTIDAVHKAQAALAKAQPQKAERKTV